MDKAIAKYKIQLPDRQLACAPFDSPEGRQYLAAMQAAANFAWANRQVLMYRTQQVLEKVLQLSPKDLGLSLVYDVAHNIIKIEEHTVAGKKIKLAVHRKGATRAYPAHHPEVSAIYRQVGQPVLIPGDMGRCSYVLVGTQKALAETFASTCHGAGRVMSRHAAIRAAKGRAINRELEDQGIIVRSAGNKTLKEEMPEAYKNVSEVVDVVHGAGISLKVAKLRPMGVIKG
jgi:tRNA-splicing ligase RtcB